MEPNVVTEEQKLVSVLELKKIRNRKHWMLSGVIVGLFLFCVWSIGGIMDHGGVIDFWGTLPGYVLVPISIGLTFMMHKFLIEWKVDIELPAKKFEYWKFCERYKNYHEGIVITAVQLRGNILRGFTQVRVQIAETPEAEARTETVNIDSVAMYTGGYRYLQLHDSRTGITRKIMPPNGGENKRLTRIFRVLHNFSPANTVEL